MLILKTIKEVRETLVQYKLQGLKSVGFVPTMGFLHPGHVSLIERARKDTDVVVVSIFVNPTQFGPNEDFSKYPRDDAKDASICKKNGVDILFQPDVQEMYPEQSKTSVCVSDITESLCGASRPGHFAGVATVVAKLFNIVTPDKAYFGEKDFQQLLLIKKMVADLNFKLEVVACPIVREADGLAMSSRNSYLGPEERRVATVLYRSLQHAQSAIQGGEKAVAKIRAGIAQAISSFDNMRIDYISVVDPDTLQEKEWIKGPTQIALAVFIGKTRLIDNISISV